jgi:hypothetical protein
MDCWIAGKTRDIIQRTIAGREPLACGHEIRSQRDNDLAVEAK